MDIPTTYYDIFIGTNSVRNSEGIYIFRLDKKSGRLEKQGTTPAYNTGSLAISKNGNRLYAVSEGMTFLGKASGGVMAYDIGENAALTLLSQKPTMGQRPCCLNLDDEAGALYASNFFGGSMAVFRVTDDGISDIRRLVKETPGDGPRIHDGMHCAEIVEPGKLVAAIYLGRGQLIFYDAETFEPVHTYQVPDGYSPRHFALSPDRQYIYLLMQNPGVIHVLENRVMEGGGGIMRQEISTIPEDYRGMYGTSSVRVSPDGRLVFAATRSADTIAVYRRNKNDGLLELSEMAGLPGETPRDFNITPDGRYLVTALQASDEVCVHRVDYENAAITLTDKAGGIPSPAAVAARERS